MKKILQFTTITIVSILFLSSCCSVQKRLYRDGYSVTWNHKKSEIKQDAVQKDITDETIIAEESTVAEVPGGVTEPQVKNEEAKESATVSVETKPVIPEKKKGIISKIIKEDTPEEIERINNGSKAAAFKSGFKKGLKLMMPATVEDRITGWAIASFVLGILSLFAYYGAFLLGLLAIIFGIIAIRKVKNEGYRGNTLAWLGLIFGIIGIILATVIIQVIV
jgi:hypothetical protein